jgi:hypothetical protein
MIFIAKDYKGRIISIISAKTKESANAYWQGKSVAVHSEEIWDIEKVRENEESGFVTPILETTKKQLTSWIGSEYIEYIVIE